MSRQKSKNKNRERRFAPASSKKKTTAADQPAHLSMDLADAAVPLPLPVKAHPGWLWRAALVVATATLPVAGATMVEWPSHLEAFLPVCAYGCAFFIPLDILRASFQAGWRLLPLLKSALAGFLAASHFAGIVLFSCALFAQAMEPVAFGGEVVDKSCSASICHFGTFDHRLNTYLGFSSPPLLAPGIGELSYRCLRPSWPKPSRMRWQSTTKCPAPDLREPERPSKPHRATAPQSPKNKSFDASRLSK